jgi:hypothetical protein
MFFQVRKNKDSSSVLDPIVVNSPSDLWMHPFAVSCSQNQNQNQGGNKRLKRKKLADESS